MEAYRQVELFLSLLFPGSPFLNHLLVTLSLPPLILSLRGEWFAEALFLVHLILSPFTLILSLALKNPNLSLLLSLVPLLFPLSLNLSLCPIPFPLLPLLLPSLCFFSNTSPGYFLFFFFLSLLSPSPSPLLSPFLSAYPLLFLPSPSYVVLFLPLPCFLPLPSSPFLRSE